MDRAAHRLFSISMSLVVAAGCVRGGREIRDDSAGFSGVPRERFNQAALALALPLFWSDDRDHDGTLSVDELAVIWGLDPYGREHWVQDGVFTVAARESFERVRARLQTGDPVVKGAEAARQAALAREIAQGRFTLVETDLHEAPAGDRALVAHILAAAAVVERLYAKQLGTYGMAAKIAPADTLSRLVFFINQGPWCSAPVTENDPACTALSPALPRRSGLYPADLQTDEDFCEVLAKDPHRDELLNAFTVVARDERGGLRAVPYHEAYREEMLAVRRELEAAAAALEGTGEKAFEAYLRAAAKAFGDNGWFAADEAWAKMNAGNSKWYLRIGPDEVYFEPCNVKAGFHVSFARIDPASLAWQRKLEPVKNEMEKTLAALAGPPYAARPVSFHFPDFLDVILNAGDARGPRGATIGQSLPNWGPVANEGRGRTVAMTNFYTDPDSRATARAQAESVLCADVMPLYTDDPAAVVLGTVLHEAAHNLGPAHEYEVGGKTDDRIFGGPFASLLEELKAQTSALYLTDWLAGRGVIAPELAARAHLRDFTWAFGHIGRGMYDAGGKIKAYSQLAAIQIGWLLQKDALVWKADTTAANGQDRGCLTMAMDELPAAIAELEKVVLGIKARGDLPASLALKKRFVDDVGDGKAALAAIAERYSRFPRASFLYAVRL